MANEVVDKLVMGKKEGLVCKLDTEKAYGHVCWNFVDYMLDKLGFGKKWRLWMSSCMTSTSFAVLIMEGRQSFLLVLGV